MAKIAKYCAISLTAAKMKTPNRIYQSGVFITTKTIFPEINYKPAASRNASALSVLSQAKEVNVVLFVTLLAAFILVPVVCHFRRIATEVSVGSSRLIHRMQ